MRENGTLVSIDRSPVTYDEISSSRIRWGFNVSGRIKDDDSSVPVPHGPFSYGWRFRPGAQYRTWFRRAVSEPEPRVIPDPEEVVRKMDAAREAAPVSTDMELLIRMMSSGQNPVEFMQQHNAQQEQAHQEAEKQSG